MDPDLTPDTKRRTEERVALQLFPLVLALNCHGVWGLIKLQKLLKIRAALPTLLEKGGCSFPQKLHQLLTKSTLSAGYHLDNQGLKDDGYTVHEWLNWTEVQRKLRELTLF